MADREGGGPHPHGAAELCAAGDRLYTEALRSGRVPREGAGTAPCLLELALLAPDPEDAAWLVPVPPQQVMADVLRATHAEVSAGQQRLGAALEALSRYAEIDPRDRTGGGVTLLEGVNRIQQAVDEALSACAAEVRTIQPGGIRRELSLVEGLRRTTDFRPRGVRMRSLYTHVARHGLGIYEYLDLVGDVVEARTLDEVPERFMAFDRTAVFIPANADRTLALEIRHPALVAYLVTTFDRLWRLALPMADQLPQADADGITARQRSIAGLLAEGHTDAVVAERLGINVRTCRAHIARLAETLGAANRTQLGVRIAQAGIAGPAGPVSTPAPESPTAR